MVARGGTDHGCHDGHAVACGALMRPMLPLSLIAVSNFQCLALESMISERFLSASGQ